MDIKKTPTKNTLYDNLRKAHPDWSPQRLYAVTGSMMNANRSNTKQLFNTHPKIG